MQPEGLVKLKTRVKARAEFSRCEDAGYAGSEGRENGEKTIHRPRYMQRLLI